ncbi:TPA: hypothetical protein N0F65_007194 [Lagenidium giganteum]|uniref:Protein kinase domain-containing protein n=1 Tax=Lagenidium giganteum TaxID=4803 RepID=A0AAV2ZCN4_9STRA|nr:TPA: hypothetical protein N0F65_007194 [Lagenidium giganteum]
MGVPHTFVRSVKAGDLSFDQVDQVLGEIKEDQPHGVGGEWCAAIAHPTWAILTFTDPNESRNTLKTLATGVGSLSDQGKWPTELFSPSALCYGIYRIDSPNDDDMPPNFVSFCWKGRSLPIYLRTKFTEFNHVIRKHLGAMAHVTLQHPNDLADATLRKLAPPRRKRSSSRRFITQEIECSAEATQAVTDIRSDNSPFNWIVCGYQPTETGQKLVVVEKGMTGLFALKGLGGISSVLKEGCTMYIYLRVDIPLHHGTERIVSKYVLVTWQSNVGSSHAPPPDDDTTSYEAPSSNSPSNPPSSSSLREFTTSASSSNLQRVATAHIYGSEIYRVFPHHVHFFASTLSEISDEAIRERVRRAVDNDCMLLRVAILLEDDLATLRKDIGLGHGDKIHVDDKNNGESSILAKLVVQINSGSAVVSLSAERRHEVQRGVEAREAELQRILSVTHDLIRRRASRDMRSPPTSSGSTSASHTTASVPHHSSSDITNDHTSDSQRMRRTHSEASVEDANRDDVSNLQEQARVLESQNKYLEIPYESIRILGGKENELGCGKAATVYRGLWMSTNGAAEVAIKLFRYVRLTDKILTDYTQEVAMLRKLKHPNIVLFIGACTNPKLMILTEFCSRKSLYEVIHNSSFSSMPWKYKVRMMLDAARGIQYLHSKRIIHRDIKSHNFLVDDDWRVKVADFGISKVLDNDTNAFTQCGTTGWVAPEVLLDEDLGYTFKADNWR